MFPKFLKLSDLVFHDNNKTIGTGAFSEVKLVSHINYPTQKFALKKLYKKDKIEEHYIKREIQLHQKMDHPNII